MRRPSGEGRKGGWADNRGPRSGVFVADARTGGAGSGDAEARSGPRDAIDDLIRPLDVAFDAAVARDEEVAADDLALSLDQDRTLSQVLDRTRGAMVLNADPEGAQRYVDGVARDYVWTNHPTPTLTPLYQAIFKVPGRRERVEQRSDTFIDRLRQLARASQTIEAATRFGTFFGTITRARRDHLELRTRIGTLLVPYAELTSVRITRGD